MKGVIINKEQDCKDLIEQIDSLFSFMFKGATTTYTHYIKHLTKEEFIVIIDKEKITHLAELLPDLFNQLPYTLEDIQTVNKLDYFKDFIL